MPKISSRDGGRPAQRTVNPIIVTRRGKIARLESGLTPQEAQIEDLVFLRKVLNRADIPYLLCLLYTSPSPRDGATSRMPSSA